jgi:hypothetical protein
MGLLRSPSTSPHDWPAASRTTQVPLYRQLLKQHLELSPEPCAVAGIASRPDRTAASADTAR